MDILAESHTNFAPAPALKNSDELSSLRIFNTSLLEQIAELRKGELERSQLKQALADQHALFRQQKDDLARKLSALTDENWAKTLEIESLEGLRQKEAMALQATKDQLSETQARLEDVTWQREQEAEQNQKLGQQILQNIETFRAFEHQANGEIQRLRNEASSSKKQIETLAADNSKLRQLLNVRDTQAEERNENLSLWQKQLIEFDQHLTHTKGALKQERTNLLHLAMQLENTVRLTAGHPFKDYLEVTERELTRLGSQLTSISEISPLRPKVEERLRHLKQQADAMRAGLSELDLKQNERLSAISAITKSLNTVPEFTPAPEGAPEGELIS